MGDSSLPKHNHSNHNNNINNGRGSPCWPPELQRIIVVEMALFHAFQQQPRENPTGDVTVMLFVD